jgi:exopolysaccharide biosynthesis polyprenyl glycosylphosphotransferase
MGEGRSHADIGVPPQVEMPSATTSALDEGASVPMEADLLSRSMGIEQGVEGRSQSLSLDFPVQPKRRRVGTVLALVSLDTAATCASVLLGLLVAGALGVTSSRPWAPALAVPTLVFSLALHGMYRGNEVRLVPSGLAAATKVVRSLPLAALATVAVLLATAPSTGVLQVLMLTACVLAPTSAVVALFRSLGSHFGTRLGLLRTQRVLVVGAGEAGDAVVQRLNRHGQITVLGMVDDDPLPGFETIGTINQLPALCEDLEVDRVIVAMPRVPWLTVSEIIRPLLGVVDVAIVPSLYELMTWRSGMSDLAGMPLVPLVAAQHGVAARCGKRILDLVVGFLALLVFAPVLLVAAVAIRLDSRGPAFFRQERAGLGGEHFRIWKFRTMVVDAESMRDDLMEQSEADGPRFKMAHDPRVTRVGRLLRRFSVDELPQLLNVLGGSMSLVGPRPFPVAEYGALSQGPSAARFDMPPGMTGLWQVSGRSDLSWDDLCRLDSVYVGSWSVLWDLRILLQTPAAVLRRTGAY